jgi:glucose-6-phosphate 1-epimerase
MPRPTRIQPVDHAGHRCLQLSSVHGTAIVALHGAQLLSWVPAGHSDVVWLSPLALPEPAAIRGGVPICWPWFGKQDMPDGAMQHGPVRNRLWDVVATDDGDGGDGDAVSVTLQPQPAHSPTDPLTRFAQGLQLSLRITLGQTLVQTLQTRNPGANTVTLTQALHSYFSVSDATRVRIAGLESLPFDDKLSGAQCPPTGGPFVLDGCCDRVYQRRVATDDPCYTLSDSAWRRQIRLTTRGSQSVVVWNPGMEGARQMADVPDAQWQSFLCIEAANAGTDRIQLSPGGQHQLTQTLAVSHWNP